MIAHARRAVPSSLLFVAAVLVVALLVLVEHWPYTLWPLQGMAVGLLAAAAAWCFDEPAAAITDTTPRQLAWQTTARSAGVVALLLVWVVAVAQTRSGYFGHALDVAWQGVAATLVVTAIVTWRRSRHVATPAGSAFAATVMVSLALAVVKPLARYVEVFPYASSGHWGGARTLWTAAAVLAVAVLWGALGGLSSSRVLRR
ncbi:MAG: hypothetical protein ABI438_03915 [Dermatophilaceae bacterium]